jgi:hypothetical protein
MLLSLFLGCKNSIISITKIANNSFIRYMVEECNYTIVLTTVLSTGLPNIGPISGKVVS